MWERKPAGPHQTSNQSFLNKEEKSKLSTKPHHLPPKTQVYLSYYKRIPFPFNSQIPNTMCFNNDKKSQKENFFGGERPKCRRHRLSQSSQKVVQVQIADEAKDRKKYKPMVRALKVRRPSDARRAVAEMAMNVWAQLVMLRSIESVKPQAMVVVAIVDEPEYLLII